MFDLYFSGDSFMGYETHYFENYIAKSVLSITSQLQIVTAYFIIPSGPQNYSIRLKMTPIPKLILADLKQQKMISKRTR